MYISLSLEAVNLECFPGVHSNTKNQQENKNTHENKNTQENKIIQENKNSHENTGLTAEEIIEISFLIGANKNIKGVSLTEYCPP